MRQLREEIRELKQRLEKCDKNTIDLRGRSEAATGASEANDDDDKAEDGLAAKCRDLEETLDMMRGEFENMEDYWQVGCKILAMLRILFFVLIVRLQNRRK